MYVIYKRPTLEQRHTQTKIKKKKIFHTNGNKKKRVDKLISDKINFKRKAVRDKRGHYIIIKGSANKKI